MKGIKLDGQQSGDSTVILPNENSNVYIGVLSFTLQTIFPHSTEYAVRNARTRSQASAR
jgi:hypothetical protein